MTAFETIAALLTMAAAFAYLNHRWTKLPPSIALMAMSLTVSLVLLLLDRAGVATVSHWAVLVLEGLPLPEVFLHGVLGLLLFAGALHIDLAELRQQRITVMTMAVAGTVLSTLLVGGLAYCVLGALRHPLSLGHCLLFGALISPTDPIAVLGVLRGAHVPRALEVQVSGESLFNDGVGVVIFMTALEMVSGTGFPSLGHVAALFLHEAVGGAVFGLCTGYLAYRLIRSIDHYQTELLLTLALVLGGYAAAERLGISAPIAAVVSGLLIGNHGRSFGMSDRTRDHLDTFWSLVDDVLNALLFVVVGLEVVRLSLGSRGILIGLSMIPVVLVARLLSVFASLAVLRARATFEQGAVWIHTWGGLRGGISVALALGVPVAHHRNVIVVMTYFVVVFSILVQGLTLGRLARRYQAP